MHGSNASAAGGACLGDHNGTASSASAPPGLNYTKLIVLSVIVLLTIVGNICVIVAIICRRIKMTRSGQKEKKPEAGS